MPCEPLAAHAVRIISKPLNRKVVQQSTMVENTTKERKSSNDTHCFMALSAIIMTARVRGAVLMPASSRVRALLGLRDADEY